MFEPCGVITLTTDIGHKGPFVATMKGMMLTRLATARIIDLTHETSVHFPAEAGFWLHRAYGYFPKGTTHVAVVDPGVGTQRDIIISEHDGHVFLAPDNGLLAPIAEQDGAVTHCLDLEAASKRLGLTNISATFHGRDIFAPIGAELAAGRVQPSDLGPESDGVVPSWIDEPRVRDGLIRGVVVAVDNFGNLITNIDQQMVAELEQPTARAAGRTFPVRRAYGEVTPGDYLALVNSFGVLELARAEKSAAESLGLGRGAPIELFDGSENDGNKGA